MIVDAKHMFRWSGRRFVEQLIVSSIAICLQHGTCGVYLQVAVAAAAAGFRGESDAEYDAYKKAHRLELRQREDVIAAAEAALARKKAEKEETAKLEKKGQGKKEQATLQKQKNKRAHVGEG
jgi:hypothetical protein